MVVKLILICCYILLFYFLAVELLDTRKWKKFVKYAGKYAFSDEEFQEIMERKRQILRENELFEWFWYHPFEEMRKARKCGFLRLPIHCQIGFADELACHTSPGYRGRILGVNACGVGWKDKYETPRFESSPHIFITLFGIIGINIFWGYRYNWHEEERWDISDYWEQALWCIYYCDGDLDKGRKTWPWSSNGISTWDEKYVKPKYRKNE